MSIIAKVGDVSQIDMQITVHTSNTLINLSDNVTVKNEVIRENLSNFADEQATEVYIDIAYVNENKVNIKFLHNGNRFKSDDDVKAYFISSFESIKGYEDIGGIGVGSNLNVASDELSVSNIENGKVKTYTWKGVKKALHEISQNKEDGYVWIEIQETSYNQGQYPFEGVEINIKGIHVDEIINFNHDHIREYIITRTIVSYTKCEDFKVHLRGLDVEKKRTKDNEEIITSNICSRINNIKAKEGVTFFDNTLEGFTEKEKEEIKKYIDEFENCYREKFKFQVLHFNPDYSEIKDEIYPLRKYKGRYRRIDDNFFGVYACIKGIIVSKRFEMSNLATGSNGQAQFLAIFNCDKLHLKPDRNELNGNEVNDVFKRVIKGIMNVINKKIKKGMKDKNDNDGDKGNKPKKEEIKLGDVNTIQGLYGELKYIESNPEMIRNWVAHQQSIKSRKPHDFEYAKTFSEIKTKIVTGDKDQNLIRISSVSQLDCTNEGKLIIYFLESHPHSSGFGENILDLIENIINILVDPEDKNKLFKGISCYLNNKKFKNKYLKIKNDTEDKYDLSNLKRFSIVRTEVYQIDKNFPKITQKMLEDNCSMLDGNTGYYLDLDKVKAKGFKPKNLD